MSTTSSSPSSAPAAKKPRSTAERMIVWGVIVALLALVGIEYTSKAGFDQVRADLEEKMQAVDKDPSGKTTVTDKDVQAILGGKAPVDKQDLKEKRIANTARKVEVYKWFS